MTFGFHGFIAETDSVVWKTEGLMDTLTIMSYGLPEGHRATCNACGAGERPDRPDRLHYLKSFIGKEVFVVHDCDQPGQAGAMGDGKNNPGWAPVLAAYADSVRNVILPYPITESGGKDVRDWILEQHKAGKEKSQIYAELLEMARNSPLVERCDASVIERIERGGEEVNGEDPDDEFGEGEDETVEASPEEHPDDPHRLARINLSVYRDEHGGHLVYWRQQWWKYREGRYRQIPDNELISKVTASIKQEFDSLWQEENERYEEWVDSDNYNEAKDKGPPRVRQVKGPLVNNVIGAMKSECLLSSSVEMPSWLPDRSRPKLVSLNNGILSLEELFKPAGVRDATKVVIDHTPEWFSPSKLPYDFDPSADCPRWKQFLAEVFNGDDESIASIQQWCGYLLLPDTSLEKMMFVIGPPRSGKGTIMRTMTAMLGRDTVANPTLSDFADRFALQGLMGKTAAMIGDVRLSNRVDGMAITERILGITGQDGQDVHRKHLDSLHGVQMPLRFTMFSNQLPQLNDSSRAIMSRCIFVMMPNSYVGREDRSLSKKIQEEMPGILNWAIAGRHAVEKEGAIIQPTSGIDTKERMEKLIAPVAFFLSNCCETGNENEVAIHDLFEAWCEWSRDNEVTWKIDIQRFSKKVHDAIPGIQTIRPRVEGGRKRVMKGISLRKEYLHSVF